VAVRGLNGGSKGGAWCKAKRGGNDDVGAGRTLNEGQPREQRREFNLGQEVNKQLKVQ